MLRIDDPNNQTSCYSAHVISKRHDLSLFSSSTSSITTSSTATTSDEGTAAATTPSSSLKLLQSTLGIEEELSSPNVSIPIFDARSFPSIHEFIEQYLREGHCDKSFLVLNLAWIERQWYSWQQELPMVHPYYAVKCNPDPLLLRLLAHWGFGFDCATEGEIDLVLHCLGSKLSLSLDNNMTLADTVFSSSADSKKVMHEFGRIVYGNPMKMRSMISYAINHQVQLTVFDSEDELYKLADMKVQHSNMKLLLRIATKDTASIFPFGKKFGCSMIEMPKLLKIAKELGFTIIGVHFHVGSSCRDAQAYAHGLEDAAIVFKEWEKLGMSPMTLVDMGGGFSGDYVDLGPNAPRFEELARVIRGSIAKFQDAYAPNDIAKLNFIAEPGRFFASDSTMAVTRVIARRGGNSKDHQSLYIDNGVYGTMNNIFYDYAHRCPLKLYTNVKAEEVEEAKKKDTLTMMPTAVFGPTCDCMDQLLELDKFTFPRCEEGDWLVFDTEGAYTHTASFQFNGFTDIPERVYCYK